MKVFHGSIEIIKKPLIIDSQRFLDFGNGFYTTTNQTQAENWAMIKQRRVGNNTKPIVSIYEINDKLFTAKNYNVKTFLKANEQWLDFIVQNRKGYQNHNYDIVKGAVANDTLYTTLSLFETGTLTKKETIVRLKIHKLYDQISFHNQTVLKELVFLESY